MNGWRRVSVTGLMLVMGFGCARMAPERTTEADVDAINQLREQEVAALRDGQVDAFLARFTDDCVVMPPDVATITGHEGLRSWAESFLEQFEMRGEYTSSNVTVAGDWAIERYTGAMTVTPRAGGESVEESVRGIHIYRRQADGTWRIAQDIWTTDVPPPSTP